jgi:hypothetical protein
MPSANFLLIQQAIETKSQIHADYQGHHREMSPHMLGYKNGYEEQALFVQFGGQSSKGAITPQTKEWRCMSVADLRNVRIVEGVFYDATDKNRRPTSCVDRIVAVVR